VLVSYVIDNVILIIMSYLLALELNTISVPNLTTNVAKLKIRRAL